jgi:hypothetical protein
MALDQINKLLAANSTAIRPPPLFQSNSLEQDMGAEQLSETLKQFTLTAQYTRIYPTLVLTEGAVHPVV